MLLHLLHHMHFCWRTSQGDRYPGCHLLVVLCLGDIADLDHPEMLRHMWFQAVQHTSCPTRRCPRWQRVRPCPGNNCIGRLREDRWQPRDLQGLVEHLGGRGVESRPRGAGARVIPRPWTWAGRRAELARGRQMSSASKSLRNQEEPPTNAQWSHLSYDDSSRIGKSGHQRSSRPWWIRVFFQHCHWSVGMLVYNVFCWN